MRIALVGDRRESVAAHGAIGPALCAAGEHVGEPVELDWIPTESVAPDFDAAAYDGLWCLPGSPYASMDGALTAIRSAREQDVPFVGT